MIVTLILYYIIVSSAVLFYGIGINRTVSISGSVSDNFVSCFKALATASSTSAMTFLVTSWLLLPVHLAELFPLVAIIFFLIFTTLSEIFIGFGLDNTPTEFTIPLLSVFLGVNEGVSIGYAVVITCSCIISWYLLVIVFHAAKERVCFYTNDKGLKTYAVLLLCLAIIMVAISGCASSFLSFILGETK